MMKKNIFNPLSIVLLYVFLHILFTFLYCFFTLDIGGRSFEYFSKSINFLPDCILVITILTSLIFRRWVKEHWILTTMLFLIGFSGLIIYIVRKYIYHWEGPYW